MKKFNNKQTYKEMQDCLDSDDELPTTYTEEPELPAYLDDDRFDEIGDLIEFPWLNNSQPKILQSQDQENCNLASVETAPETHKNEITPILPLAANRDTLSKKGIFEEWDSTLSPNPLQTNETETDLLTIPLTTDGHIMIKKGYFDNSCFTSESEQSDQETPEREVTPTIHPPANGGRTLIKKGILKEQDVLCIKSFAAQITDDDSALLWFIDFLANKDLQSEYNFLKSCLVPIQKSDESSSQMCLQTLCESSSFKNKFTLIVI